MRSAKLRSTIVCPHTQTIHPETYRASHRYFDGRDCPIHTVEAAVGNAPFRKGARLTENRYAALAQRLAIAKAETVLEAEQSLSTKVSQIQPPLSKTPKGGVSETPGSTTKTHAGSTVINLVSSSPPRRCTTTLRQHTDEAMGLSTAGFTEDGSADLSVIQLQPGNSDGTKLGPYSSACRKAVYYNTRARQTIADLVWQVMQPLCPWLRPWKWNEGIDSNNDMSLGGADCQYSAESIGPTGVTFAIPTLNCGACGVRHSISTTMPASIALGVGSLSQSQWDAIFDGDYSWSSIVSRCAFANRWN
jgi:hypothetical protein